MSHSTKYHMYMVHVIPPTLVTALIEVGLTIINQSIDAPDITTTVVVIQPCSSLYTPTRCALVLVAISPRCSPLASGCTANFLLWRPPPSSSRLLARRACPCAAAASSRDRPSCSATGVSAAAAWHSAPHTPRASWVCVMHAHGARTHPSQLSRAHPSHLQFRRSRGIGCAPPLAVSEAVLQDI